MSTFLSSVSILSVRKNWMLFILTSIWVLRTPNVGRNSHFQRFFCKKAKKARNLHQIFAKNTFFWVCTQTPITVLFPKKWAFLSKKPFYLWNVVNHNDFGTVQTNLCRQTKNIIKEFYRQIWGLFCIKEECTNRQQRSNTKKQLNVNLGKYWTSTW